MALVIRMRQQGTNNRQSFRVVVTDERTPRDGKYIEMMGWYNPFSREESNFALDVPRLQYWIDRGAQISDRVKSLVRRAAPEVVQKMQAKRDVRLTKKRLQRKKTNAV